MTNGVDFIGSVLAIRTEESVVALDLVAPGAEFRTIEVSGLDGAALGVGDIAIVGSSGSVDVIPEVLVEALFAFFIGALREMQVDAEQAAEAGVEFGELSEEDEKAIAGASVVPEAVFFSAGRVAEAIETARAQGRAAHFVLS